MLVLKLDDGAPSNQLRVAKCETMSDELCKEDQGAVYHRVMSLAGRQRGGGSVATLGAGTSALRGNL